MPVSMFPLKGYTSKDNTLKYPKGFVVYQILNLENNKSYIGHASSLKNRLKSHRKTLIENRHHSSHLQRSFNKYGINNFCVKVLEVSTKDQIVIREQYWIDTLRTSQREFGYNFADARGSALGLKRRLETVEKLRQTVLDRHRKDIIQKSLDGKVIKVWMNTNLVTIAKELSVSQISLCHNLKKRNKSCGGFVFEHLNIK